MLLFYFYNMESNNQCLSCSASLYGNFCHECGERVVESNDFTLKKIIGDGINIFTNLDSKLFKSFTTLLFRPGKLTVEYLRGRRKPYMKPFQIFLIVTVVFFIIIYDFDAFLVPSQWFFTENYEMGIRIMDLVREKMEEKSMTKNEIAVLYDSEVAGYSKLFLVTLLPFIALLTYLFKRKSMPEFGKHFILAIHNFSFLTLWMLLSLLMVMYTPVTLPKWLFVSLTLGIIYIYIAISFQTVWNLKWWKTLIMASFVFILLFLMIFFYRIAVSYFTLKFL